MVEKGHGGHMRPAEEGIERHVADFEPAAPGSGQSGVRAPAAFFDQGDGGIERFPLGRMGGEVVSAPFGIVRQIARTLPHHGVEQQKRDKRRDGMVPTLR